MAAHVPASWNSSDAAPPPPTLSLRVAGDIQQAVHFNYKQDSREFYRSPSLVAPRYALTVSPQGWVTIYTNSRLGPPQSAHARIFLSALPTPCFGNVLIGCVQVDFASGGYEIPLHPDADASFGFVAPSAPGPYWIALQADWGYGMSTQVFVIDVRALSAKTLASR